MPPIMAVIKPGHGYQIHAACQGIGCAGCHGMGEIPAVRDQQSAVRSQSGGTRSVASAALARRRPAEAGARRIVQRANRSHA